MSHVNERTFFWLRCSRVFKGHPVCVEEEKRPHCFWRSAFEKTLLSCHRWYGNICTCRSIGLFWPERGDGKMPRAVFDTSVNLITIKQGREKSCTCAAWNIQQCPPASCAVIAHSWGTTRGPNERECWGELIPKMFTQNQHGRPQCLPSSKWFANE